MTGSAPRAVIVGTGFGCRIQMPALRGAGFEITALVGSDPARTAERAATNGIARSFTDLDAAIDLLGDAADKSLVVISTPPDTHAPLSLRAIARGCHVLCEKPFAMDAAEARGMLDAATRARRIHVLGNEFRFEPQRVTVARAIAEGAIGTPRFASFVQFFGFLNQCNEDFADWWFDPAQGGGWLGASGSHLIDQVRTWLGEFESVSASLPNVATTRGPVEDSFSVLFRLKNGVEGVLQQTSVAPGPMTTIVQVVGTEGRIWIDDGTVRIADATGERALPIAADLELPPPPSLGDDPRQAELGWQLMAAAEIAPYTQLCRTVGAAMTGAAPPGPVAMATFADGVANMAVIDAIRRSAKNGGSFEKVLAA